MSRKTTKIYIPKHGVLWWLFIGWWWRPIMWFFLAMLGYRKKY